MSVAETSRVAYQTIKKTLGDKQEAVYEAIKFLGQATNEQIADYLEWAQHKVTGRVHELADYGMVVCIGMGKNKSGIGAKLWAVTDPNDKNLKMF